MIDQYAQKATREITEKIASLTEEQQRAVRKIVEQAIVASVHDTVQKCRDAATTCCGKNSAMTTQIREEIQRAETALIANLSALR